MYMTYARMTAKQKKTAKSTQMNLTISCLQNIAPSIMSETPVKILFLVRRKLPKTIDFAH